MLWISLVLRWVIIFVYFIHSFFIIRWIHLTFWFNYFKYSLKYANIYALILLIQYWENLNLLMLLMLIQSLDKWNQRTRIQNKYLDTNLYAFKHYFCCVLSFSARKKICEKQEKKTLNYLFALSSLEPFIMFINKKKEQEKNVSISFIKFKNTHTYVCVLKQINR